MRSAGTPLRRLAQLRRLRIRDVAGERDVVPALEGDVEQLGLGEAVEDHVAAEAAEHVRRLTSSRARVDDDRERELLREPRGAPRRAAVAPGAARSRGSDRAPSRPPLPHDRARAAREARPAAARRPSRHRADGCRARRTRPAPVAARSSAALHDSTLVPTVTTRVTPAERARSSTAGAASAQASRCACVSIKRPRRARHAGRAAAPARCRSPARARPSERRSQATSVLWPSACRIAGAGRRQIRVQRDRDGTDPVREVVEHRVELGRLVVVLRQLPGLRALDEPVELSHDVPDRLQRARELPRFEPAGDLVVQRVEPGGDLRSARPARQLAVAVSRDHRRRPREEVAELVRQLPLIAFVERVLGGAHRRVRTSPNEWPSSAPDHSRTRPQAGAGR